MRDPMKAKCDCRGVGERLAGRSLGPVGKGEG